MTALAIAADRIGLHSVAEWFKRLQASMARERLARQTIKELSSLSDRELNDMGLSRCDIYSVAYGDGERR